MSQILKGEIYWANLSPTIGSEISKTRPVLVVSNNINNQFAATVSILPITSTTAKVYPFEVFLPKGEGNLANDSKAKANQIRTIDRQRIGNRIGKISKAKLTEIEDAILIHLEIDRD
ncbi:MAG TPA: type II toxin-antitoxin system PemK/MazF family toxin [Pyrinomonadaceae bacterium]|jgi:mRNA interferase MazF